MAYQSLIIRRTYNIICHAKLKKHRVNTRSLIIPIHPKNQNLGCGLDIYTDASIMNASLGIGVWSPDYNICISRTAKGLIDINRGELAAILCALVYINQRSVKEPIKRDIIIHTDSFTSIQLIRGEIQNEKFQQIVDCIQYIKNQWYGKIIIQKVKSHSGNIGNDGADILAKYSLRDRALSPQSSVILPDEIDAKLSIKDRVDFIHSNNTFER